MNYKNNGTKWEQALASRENPWNKNSNNLLTQYVLIENNTIYNSWGEGIDLLYCEFCIVRNNTIKNAFGELVYIDNSRNCIVENNFLYVTTNDYNYQLWKRRAHGIGFSSENYLNINTTNITIRNNLILGVCCGITHINYEGYYDEIHIVHNTLINIQQYGIFIHPTKNISSVKNNEISNNVIAGSFVCYNEEEFKKWKGFSNVWVDNEINFSVLDDYSGYENTSIIINKMYNESLYPSTNENCFDIEKYLPRCIDEIKKDDIYGNVLIGKGIKSDFSNGMDYFNNKRNVKKPSIGFAEYCTINGGDNESQKNNKNSIFLVIILIVAGIIVSVIIALLIYIIIKKKF